MPDRPVKLPKRKPARPAPGPRANVIDTERAPQIVVSGDAVANALVIPFTDTSLLMIVGRYEEDKSPVLAPYVEMRLASESEETADDDDAAVETVFSAVLSFENASFIVADMCCDMATSAKNLRSMAAGDLPVDASRMAFVLRNIAWARSELESFASEIRQILERQGVNGYEGTSGELANA
jgi:hypothetical protein